jgi:hypothetical protein
MTIGKKTKAKITANPILVETGVTFPPRKGANPIMGPILKRVSMKRPNKAGGDRPGMLKKYKR